MGSITNVPLRIASASGSVTDRRHAFAVLAQHEDVQFIVGDWMSEYNMTTRGGSKVNSQGVSEEFEETFVEAIEPALRHLDERKIKVAVNAGGSDTRKLHDTIVKMIKDQRLGLKVAWVEGDEVSEVVQKSIKQGNEFKSLTHGMSLNSSDNISSLTIIFRAKYQRLGL